jgi:hypothetical protein
MITNLVNYGLTNNNAPDRLAMLSESVTFLSKTAIKINDSSLKFLAANTGDAYPINVDLSSPYIFVANLKSILESSSNDWFLIS